MGEPPAGRMPREPRFSLALARPGRRPPGERADPPLARGGRALNANQLPNLGGRLVGAMSIPDQLEMGLYLEGRGLHGAVFRSQVRRCWKNCKRLSARPAQRRAGQFLPAAMLEIYPLLAPLLHLMPGKPHHAQDKTTAGQGLARMGLRRN